MTSPPPAPSSLAQIIQGLLARGLIGFALLFPPRFRIALFRKVLGDWIGPMVGWRKRALSNLELVWPDRPRAERARIARDALRSAAQVIIENFDPEDMKRRGHGFPVSGPGLAALEAARAKGTPLLLISGHFANHEAIRAALLARGIGVGGIYRPMTNAIFNRPYRDAMARMGEPIFPSDGKGTGPFLRALRAGTPMMLLNDLVIWKGEMLDFLGHPARTATSAARMALKTGAVVLPIHAIRDARDGMLYRIEIDAPVPHTDPIEMTMALNRALEARIHAAPGQWFWVHRRWK